MGAAFLAVDWGTTNRRVFLIEEGRVRSARRDPLGVRQMDPRDYEAEVNALRQSLGDAPMLLAGMVGSTIGWKNTGYAAAPAGFAEIADALTWIDRRTAIVPGVSMQEGAHIDVMRGEEVHFLGAAALGAITETDLLCQPGTHNKWATMAQERIVGFTTVMTGEIFELLRVHSILAHDLSGEVNAGDEFLQGVHEGARQDIMASLFSVRAKSVLGLAPPGYGAAFVSGLLIGADVSNRIKCGKRVHVIANPAVGKLYGAAISALGGDAILMDSETAFVAGISRLASMVRIV